MTVRPKKCILISLLIIFSVFAVNGLKVIFESAKVTYTNDKYIEGVVMNVRRYQRNGNIYLNMYGTVKHTWTNNVTVSIVVTQFLHNEYRRSFVEFHYGICDLVNKEPFFGAMLRQRGVVCPAPKGLYRLMNMTVQSQGFPNVWPFEKGGADITIKHTDTGEIIAEGYVHCSFKQDKKD